MTLSPLRHARLIVSADALLTVREAGRLLGFRGGCAHGTGTHCHPLAHTPEWVADRVRRRRLHAHRRCAQEITPC